jgi:hypothetical protein
MIPVDIINCATRLSLYKYYFFIIVGILFNYFITSFSLHYNSQHHVALQTCQTNKFIEIWRLKLVFETKLKVMCILYY